MASKYFALANLNFMFKRCYSVNKYGEWIKPVIKTYSPPPFPLLIRPNESITAKRRRCLYNSRKRGILETDLLLSGNYTLYLKLGWAKAHLNSLSLGQLAEYEILLHENDWNIYYWLTDSQTPPDHILELSIFESIKEYAKNSERKILRMPSL